MQHAFQILNEIYLYVLVDDEQTVTNCLGLKKAFDYNQATNMATPTVGDSTLYL